MVKKTYPLLYAGEKQTFAQSVVVGDLIFVSGCSGRTVETGAVSGPDPHEQTRISWEKVRRAFEEAGGVLDNLVKFTVYLKHGSGYRYPDFEKDMVEYFKKYAPSLINEPPAWTLVEVPSLAYDNMLVEVCAMGVLGK